MVEKTMGPWRTAIQNRRHSSTRFPEQKPRLEARERWRSRLGDDEHVDRQKNANSFVGIIVNDNDSPRRLLVGIRPATSAQHDKDVERADHSDVRVWNLSADVFSRRPPERRSDMEREPGQHNLVSGRMPP